MEGNNRWIVFGILVLGTIAYKLLFGMDTKDKLKKNQDLPEDIQIRIKKTFQIQMIIKELLN